MNTAEQLLSDMAGRRFGTFLADPPWQFQNRTGKVAPEHRRLRRYETMKLEIMGLPVAGLAAMRRTSTSGCRMPCFARALR